MTINKANKSAFAMSKEIGFLAKLREPCGKAMNTALILSIVILGGYPGQGPISTAPTLVRAVGTGFPPSRVKGAQARLLARRAAEVSALRNLATKLELRRHGRLPPFRYVSTKHLPNGSIEVTVETIIPIHPAGIRLHL